MKAVYLTMDVDTAKRTLAALNRVEIRGLEAAEALVLLAKGLLEGIKETEEEDHDDVPGLREDMEESKLAPQGSVR